MIVNLYKNMSENEKLSKALQPITEVEGTLKSEISILTPIIELSGIDSYIRDVNYCYIPDFRRYYYVTNTIVVGTNIVQFELEVDVLMSFGSEILNNYAVIGRNEYDYNMELRDVNIPTYCQTSIRYINFPSAFNTFKLVVPIMGN